MGVSKYDIELDLTVDANSSHALVASLTGAGKTVLDVGCDTGYLGESLQQAGNVVWGVEMNPASAEVARRHYERVEIGDLEALDLREVFAGQQFDVIIFADVLEHLRDPLPTLRQARSMLSAGGVVIISVPNVAHGDLRLNLLRGRFDYTDVGLLDTTHTRFFTATSLEQFVTAAGFVMPELRRARQPLFHTEVDVARDDFAPTVVAGIEDDLEATTYQLIARLVPADVVEDGSDEAARVESLRAQLHEHRSTTARAEPASAGDVATRHALLRATDRALGLEVARARQQRELDSLHTALLESRGGLGRRDATIARAAERIRSLEQTVRTQQKELAVSAQETRRTREQLAALHASRTWRIGQAVVRPAARVSKWGRR